MPRTNNLFVQTTTFVSEKKQKGRGQQTKFESTVDTTRVVSLLKTQVVDLSRLKSRYFLFALLGVRRTPQSGNFAVKC